MGTYIDMGPTVEKPVQHIQEKNEDEILEEQRTGTAEMGVNSKRIIFFFYSIRKNIYFSND